MALVKQVYADTAGFPSDERFGLALQMRRAAVSVPSNIAEGAARRSSKEFAHFLSIALESLAELDTQMELAIALGFLEQTCKTLEARADVAKLVTGLRRSIEAKSHRSQITDH